MDDGIDVLLSAMLEVTETIAVDDGIAVLPSAMLEVTETIAVDDGIDVLPSAMLDVTETIAVDDGIAATVTAPPAPVQLAITTVFRRDAAGQYIAAITVRNPASIDVTGLQLTTAILNTTPAAPLPVQVGTLPAGGQLTIDVTFPASAGNPGAGNTLRLTFSWTGRSTSVVQRVVLPPPPPPLGAWADLHPHPMSNPAFGGELFHGAPDGQSRSRKWRGFQWRRIA